MGGREGGRQGRREAWNEGGREGGRQGRRDSGVSMVFFWLPGNPPSQDFVLDQGFDRYWHGPSPAT